MSKEQHQPGAADATENARHSVALRSAQLTMLQLRPRRHCRRWGPPSKPCAEVAEPSATALRPAVALPPGLDATSTKRRVNVVAAAPSSMALDLRPAFVRATRPALAVAPLRATYVTYATSGSTSMPARACPTSGRSGHQRTGSPRLRARNYSRARSASRFMQSLRPSSQRHGGKVSHLWPRGHLRLLSLERVVDGGRRCGHVATRPASAAQKGTYCGPIVTCVFPRNKSLPLRKETPGTGHVACQHAVSVPLGGSTP